MTKSSAGHEFLEPEEWESWGALMLLHRLVLQDLDVGLRRAHGISITEFDVLITLFNAPASGLRMSQLAETVVLTPSGLTHLVGRLERAALVQRVVDQADRRSFFAVLTPAGDSRLAEARITHNALIREQLARKLTGRQLETLGSIMDELSAG